MSYMEEFMGETVVNMLLMKTVSDMRNNTEYDGIDNVTLYVRAQDSIEELAVKLKQVCFITYFSLYSVYIQCEGFAKLTFLLLQPGVYGRAGWHESLLREGGCDL